jgi:iron(III) transport system permease protein
LLRSPCRRATRKFGPRFLQLAGNSFLLATLTALVACGLAVALAYARRIDPRPAQRLGHGLGRHGLRDPRLGGRGRRADPAGPPRQRHRRGLRTTFGWQHRLILTGGIAALVYACVVRFMAPALQTVDSALAGSRRTWTMPRAAWACRRPRRWPASRAAAAARPPDRGAAGLHRRS